MNKLILTYKRLKVLYYRKKSAQYTKKYQKCSTDFLRSFVKTFPNGYYAKQIVNDELDTN